VYDATSNRMNIGRQARACMACMPQLRKASQTMVAAKRRVVLFFRR